MPDAFVVPRTVLETLGGLDEKRFQMYHEEADLGARIPNLGLRAVVAKNARIHHYGWTEVSLGRTMVRAQCPTALHVPDEWPGTAYASTCSIIEAFRG